MTNFKRGKTNKPTCYPYKPTERELQAAPRKIRKLGPKPCKFTKGEHEWDGKKHYSPMKLTHYRDNWEKRCSCGKKMETVRVCQKCANESTSWSAKCVVCGTRTWGSEFLTPAQKFLKESNAIENVWDDDSLKQAEKAWESIYGKVFLTVADINRAHGILMKGKLETKYVGAFRDCPVWIGGREAPHWSKVAELAEKWVEKYAGPLAEFPDTMEKIKKAHVAWEHNHPHIDGNGRIGRILYLWHVVRTRLPVVPIYEKTKSTDYYPWFEGLSD